MQIGLLTWTDQDSWRWGIMIIQAGYVLINADLKHPYRITPSTWVVVLPPYLSPRDCAFLGSLKTRTLLVTPQISAGLAVARLSRHPFCIAHPHRLKSNLPRYLDLIQHLTSGSLAFA